MYTLCNIWKYVFSSTEYKAESKFLSILGEKRVRENPYSGYAIVTAWKVSKYEVLSGPYFPVFGLNTGKYGPRKTTSHGCVIFFD